MPRKRKSNKHLPERVYFKNGAFRFLPKNPPKGSRTWITLGKTTSEMWRAYAELQISNEQINTVNQLIDRYLLEIAPQKSAASYKDNLYQSKYLKAFFGEMLPRTITPVDIYKYLDIRSKAGKTSANREFALFSHICSYGIRWGLMAINPCSGVKKFSEKRRSRNVSKEEFEKIYSIATYPINYAMKLLYLMGLRPNEVLNLKMNNITSEGFLVELTKTKHSVSKKLVQWSDELRELVNQLVKQNKLKSKEGFLLCNTTGQPYTYDGFSTLWQRTMKKAVADGLIENAFQFRDIRHKAATDLEKSHGREAARQLLGHTSQNTTARYIDGVRVVQPLESSN